MTCLAPRGIGVFCTQCGEVYAIEPDRCAKCGCQGFQYKRTATMEEGMTTSDEYPEPRWRRILDRLLTFLECITGSRQ